MQIPPQPTGRGQPTQQQHNPPGVPTRLIFPCGGPVTGEHLVGREKEVQRLSDMLGRGQSVVLVGPRRYGKTSVVFEVLERLKDRQGLHTAYVDLFKVNDIQGLATLMVGTALDNEGFTGAELVALARRGLTGLKQKIKVAQLTAQGLEVLLEFTDRSDPYALLGSALDFPDGFAGRHHKRAAVGLDEVGELLTLGEERLLKFMRAHFQVHENTAYLFSGSQESLLTRLFTHKTRAFYGFARVERLEPVPLEAWRPYIGKTFHEHGIECPADIIEALLQVTRGHPYYTQHLCLSLFYQVRRMKTEVELQDLDTALEQTLSSHRNYFDELWGSIRRASPVQRELTRSLALEPDTLPYSILKGRTSNAAVYRALQSLLDKGILGRESRGPGEGGRGGRYWHLDPLFQLYLRRMDALGPVR